MVEAVEPLEEACFLRILSELKFEFGTLTNKATFHWKLKIKIGHYEEPISRRSFSPVYGADGHRFEPSKLWIIFVQNRSLILANITIAKN